MFFLSGDHDERLRLKSFASSSSGTKTTIRIVIECDDLREAAYALQRLADVQAEQKANRAAEARRPKMLALPAPEAK